MAATPQHARRVLGLDDRATLADIRRVRRKMALKYHPDLSANQTRAATHMARVNAAADTLTAHLRERTGKAPRYPDFSNPTPPPRTKTGAVTPVKNVPSAPATVPSKTPTSPRKTQRTDTTLAQFASTSYAHNLDQIGEGAPSPTVNVKVLKFP